MKTNKLKLTCITICLIMMYTFVNANNQALEKLTIHTDKDLYLTGETVWFKVYSFNTENELGSDLSKVVYVELYNIKHNIFYKKKLYLTNGVSSNAFELPIDLTSGSYIIRAYTNYLKNFPPECFAHHVISVINPDKRLTTDLKTENKVLNTDEIEANINITSDKENYSARDLVNLSIKKMVKDNNLANLSVAVIKKGSSINNQPLKLKAAATSSQDLQFLPETRDVSISGIVNYTDNSQPAKNIPVYVSVFGENPMVYIHNSDEEGRFFFTLNNFTENQNVFITAKTPNHKEVKFKINNDFSPNYAEIDVNNIKIDETHENILKEMNKNAQIQNSFNNVNYKFGKTKTPFPFCFYNPNYKFNLGDFIKTPTMEMVIRELIAKTKLYKKNGGYGISLYNPTLNISYNDPLILIDDIPIFDANEILKIATSKVEEFEVYNSSFVIGDHTINGVLRIKTNTDDFGDVKIPEGALFFEYQAISTPLEFEAPKYNSNKDYENPQPDYRNLLYWNPSVEIIDNEANLQFYTSDHKSEYEIIVKGYSNTGKYYYGKSTISVK